MTPVELKQQLSRNDVSGCFLFCGEEDYLIRYYRDSLRKCILTDPAFSPLNHPVFDGAEVSLDSIEESVKTMPIMADLRLIEWQHANLDERKESEIERLVALSQDIANHYEYAILLITCESEFFTIGSQKQKSPKLKALEQAFQVVVFPKSTEPQLLNWIARHFTNQKLSITADVCRYMLAQCGKSMTELSLEIDKVCCYLLQNNKTQVSIDDIRLICSTNHENDTFALTNALLEGQVSLAFSALEELKSKRVDPQVVAGQLFRFYCDLSAISTLLQEGKNPADMQSILKMHEYKVKLYSKAARRLGHGFVTDALALCRHTDLYLKSVYIDAYLQIEKMLVRLAK